MISKRIKKSIISLAIILFISVSLYINFFKSTPENSFPKSRWHSTRDNSKTAFVFVHGVLSDLEGCWTNPKSKTYWPSLLKTDENFSEDSIFTVGYKSSIDTKSFSYNSASHSVFQDLKSIENSDGRTVLQHENIVFVCHSLGGIVVRELLLDNQKSFENKNVGFLLYGTPSRGSNYANYLKLVNKAIGNEQATELQKNNPTLIRSHERFKREIINTKTQFNLYGREFFEEKSPFNGQNLIVHRSDGGDYFKNPSSIHDTDHFSLVKPSDKDSKSHLYLRQFYISFLKNTGQAKLKNLNDYLIGGKYIIDEELVLEGDSPIEIYHDILIKESGVLKLLPNTLLKLGSKVSITCKGQILVQGTAKENVVFEALDATKGWGHLAIVETEKRSVFNNCIFRGGRGGKYEMESPTKYSIFKHPANINVGGALLLYKASNVHFLDCQFKENKSAAGGALCLRKSRRIHFIDCKFLDNISQGGTNAPGGAMFLQDVDEVYLSSCLFERNKSLDKWSCGGAIYAGINTSFIVKNCTFGSNKARYVGGAIYSLNTERLFGAKDSIVLHDSQWFNENILDTIIEKLKGKGISISHDAISKRRGSKKILVQDNKSRLTYVIARQRSSNICKVDVIPMQKNELTFSDVKFISNSSEEGGGAMFIDKGSSIFLTNSCRFEKNLLNPQGIDKFWNGSAIYVAGKPLNNSILNNRHTIFSENKVKGGIDFMTEVKKIVKTVHVEPASFYYGPKTIDNKKVEAPDNFSIQERLLPRSCFDKQYKDREINTIIIHHISAINWRNAFKKEDYKPIEEKYGLYNADIQEIKYSEDLCIEILKLYNFSAHYLINRQGKVYRLVHDKDVAFHAGLGKMPGRKNPENINLFSLGIELISSHPDDDSRVTKDNAYTAEQYVALNQLIKRLENKYHIEYLLGHDDIAGEGSKTFRKTIKKDPGVFFDWSKVLRAEY